MVPSFHQFGKINVKDGFDVLRMVVVTVAFTFPHTRFEHKLFRDAFRTEMQGFRHRNNRRTRRLVSFGGFRTFIFDIFAIFDIFDINDHHRFFVLHDPVAGGTGDDVETGRFDLGAMLVKPQMFVFVLVFRGRQNQISRFFLKCTFFGERFVTKLTRAIRVIKLFFRHLPRCGGRRCPWHPQHVLHRRVAVVAHAMRVVIPFCVGPFLRSHQHRFGDCLATSRPTG